MVFTHACVAHQSFQEPSNLLKKDVSLRKIAKSSVVNISYQGHKSIPSCVIGNRMNIEELIADGNYFTENIFNMPIFPKLKKLSISNNRIRNIGTLLSHIQKSCPCLEILNIQKNPGWPLDSDVQNVQKYRKLVISSLKLLAVLNDVKTHRRRISTTSTISSTMSESSDF